MQYLEATPLVVADQQAKLFAQYLEQERAARGLKPTDSLDVEIRYVDGKPIRRVLPMTEAVTTRYVDPVVSDDQLIAAIPLDDFALAQHGKGGVDLSTSKDESALDARLQAKLSAQPIEAPKPGLITRMITAIKDFFS